MTRLLIIALLALPVFAQREPSLALRQYLDLNNDQVASIIRLNGQFERLTTSKMQRQQQVQMELSEEMSRETLDPMAIGVRHVELEAIRRELQAEQGKTTTQIEALLTPAQRTKLAALREMVIATYPVACEAISFGLMIVPPVAYYPNSPIPPQYQNISCTSSRWFNTSTFRELYPLTVAAR